MAKNIYMGIDGVARKVKQPHFGVGGVARKVKAGYIGVGGVARQFYSSGPVIGDLAVDSIVPLNIGGVSKNFIVVKQGPFTSTGGSSVKYDASCDGTWLMMEDIYTKMVWDTTNNDYENSDVHNYLNGTFLGLFDSEIQSLIKQIKIPYQKGTGVDGYVRSGANGLSTKIFLLSWWEAGFGYYDGVVFDGWALDTAYKHLVAKLNGTATDWWTRSPRDTNDKIVNFIASSGGGSYTNCTTSKGIRPALILPSDTPIDANNNVIA